MSQLVLTDNTGIFGRLSSRLSYKAVFLNALQKLHVGTLHLTLPDGSQNTLRGQVETEQTASMHIRDDRFYKALMTKGNIGMAESYRDGWVDSSDMLALLLLAIKNQSVLNQALRGKWYGKLLYRIKHWQNRNTKTNSKKNIHAHYDLGNDFYQLWLDESMTYSSAIFDANQVKTEDLSIAQERKYARMFDQANLKAGDKVLEIGCGWGGFAEYAAKRDVHVVGVSLSKEQLNFANERLAKQGLDHLCDLRFQDYRDIPETDFDAIVSIEMIEAVGHEFWDSYFDCLHSKVKSGGHIVVQSITIADETFDSYKNSTDFIQQYIFPGGMLPAPKSIKQMLKTHHLKLTDYFEFGIDYAETLRRWEVDFEEKLSQIRMQGFDEAFIKIWRFYYIYCQAGFLSGNTDVCQFTAVKG